MKRNNVFTAIFALTSLLNFADTQNSYQGSQAYNANYKGNLSVNQATGTLYFSYPLIQAPGVYQAFHFNIEYRRNQKALFGLPKSWRFSLDYIDGKTANINNQQWLTDPLWHDEQGFGSGLRYFNLHSTKFFDAGFVLPVPNRPDLRYRYRLTLKDGTKKYFSHEGWLIYINDRFGNTIEFHYSPIAEDLKSSRLDWIKDEYGNKYVFRYAPQSLTIISPDKRETTLYFNEHGVTQIINPIQQSIDIHYIEQYGQSLIQSIETAEGLITELHFSTIDIKQHGKIVKLPVIDAVNKTDKKGTQLLEQTFYSHALDNNFTGFPKYSLSDTTDNLIDSNDQSFRYSVTVKRNQLRTDKAAFHQQTFYYNYLHLPVDIITTLDNQPLTKTCFEYDISPFRYSRLTNYDKPITTTNYIWIKDTASWLASDRKTATYDWFGNQTEEKHEVYNRTTQSWVAIYGSGATFDNDYYGLPKEKRITDYIQSQHIQTRYTFTDDHKAHKSKTVTFKKDKDTDWQLWKTYQLTYDAKGRKVYEKMAWAENTAIQPNSTCIHTQYEQDDEKHQLTRTETSALGNKKQFIFDTQSGFLIQSITPKGDNTNYQYDAIGRLIKVSDSLGIRQITQYKDFQTDNLNATTVTSPLGCQKRTRYDALKRPLENQDFYGKSWRQLEAFKYDGLGNKIQETNRLGLSTKRQFDTQNRLIEETDPWGNHKTLTYKDNQLTTDIHLNHNKLMTILSVPWENTLIQRMYPLASKEEPLLTPIENTQKKNGFGQVYLTKLANTKDTLTTTLCSYDPEHNPSVCEYKTKEALTLNEYHEYDLFNNRIHTVKIQQENGQTYKNSTIRQLFSRDNNLISLTRPEESQAYQAFDYDANDNLISIKQSGKPTISYDYDKRDQRIQQIWQRGTIPYWVKTAYDLDGRIIKQSASDESELTYNYTNNGIIDLINYSDGQYIKFTHDLHDRKIAIENNQGFFQQNIYDDKDKGKLSEIHLGYNSFQFGYGTDKYQLHGRLINQQTHTLSSGQSETRFCYGPTGKRQRAKTNYREPSIRYDVNYQYNLLGQLTQLSTQAEKGTTVQASDTEYTYDGLDRLIKANDHIQEKAIAFHYDANNSIVSEASNNQGNVKQIHYHYSPSGMLKKSLSNNGVIEYQHDTQGRMIQQEANKYIYDDADFLLQVISKNGLLTTFDYWPNGLLKSVNRAIGSDRHSQKYYFDDNTQLHEIQDINHSTHFVRDNTHIIASTSDSGIAHWFTANGNTGLAIDKGEANVFEYLPYGTPKKHTDQTEIMLGWKQHFYDPLTQLAYLNNRFYAPDIKQFLTPDKQLNPNLYNFGEANPMMFDDPNGLNAQRYINYAVGTSSVAFGVYATYESILLAIVGAILAVPTGGTSLSLSAGSAIAASVASTASGIALLGAQGAMDTGHPTTANALNYTSLAFSAVHVVTGLLALAPKAESLLERLGQFFSQRGGITNIHPEADASTIYHIGSDLYEGEKDVAKMLSASDIIRHGLHVTTKVTTDSFNISKALDKGKPPTYRQTIGGNAQNNPSLITAPRLNHRGNEHCLNSHCLSTGNQPSQIKSWHQRNQAINQHRQYDINLVDGFFNHDATSLFDNQL